jgi:hypothetical protein
MSHSNWILNLQDIKDKNIKLKKNNLFYEKFNDIFYKVIEVTHTYKPLFSPCCGYLFNDNQTYEKNDFKSSDTLLLDIFDHRCILKLKKHRFLCHSYNKSPLLKNLLLINIVLFPIVLNTLLL